MIGNLNEGMNTFFDWNLILDQEGGPNHVKNFCDAPYLRLGDGCAHVEVPAKSITTGVIRK